VSEYAGGAQKSDTVSIGLLANVFPTVVVDTAISRADVKEPRNRARPAKLMVYFVIAMWLWSTYVRVLRQLLAGLRWAAVDGERISVPYDGSIAKARVRLGDVVMADLFTGCAGPAGRVGDAEVFFEGLRVCAIDGSVLDAKPTSENLAAFAQPRHGRPAQAATRRVVRALPAMPLSRHALAQGAWPGSPAAR